jgi:hypothetical protein
MTFSAIRWAALALCHVVVICSCSKSLSIKLRNSAILCWESRPRWRNLLDETGMIFSEELLDSRIKWIEGGLLLNYDGGYTSNPSRCRILEF